MIPEDLNDIFTDRLSAHDLANAVDVLLSRRLAPLGRPQAPVDLEAIGDLFSVRRIEYDVLPCDGVLSPMANGGYKVVLAIDQDPLRRRFSLAHEIAHAAVFSVLPELKHTANRSLFDEFRNDDEERLCDLIASRLLMPTSMFGASVAGRELSLAALRAVSSQFQVSLSAALRRWREIARLAAAFVRLSPQADKGVAVLPVINFEKGRLWSREWRGFREDSTVIEALQSKTWKSGWDWIPEGFVRRRLHVDLDARPVSRGRCAVALLCVRKPEPLAR